MTLFVHDVHAKRDRLHEKLIEVVTLPELLFHPVPVERHLDCDMELPVLHRLQEVPEWFRHFCPLEVPVVGEGGNEDDRYVHLFPDDPGRLDAVHGPAEHDVHQHKVRPESPGLDDRLLPRDDRRRHGITEMLQAHADVTGDDILILDDQNFHRRHIKRSFR